MNIRVKCLGPIDYAEFSLGDFTLVCGRNNTGKTYATYCLYGFFSFWRDRFWIPPKTEEIDQLLASGSCRIDLSPYLSNAQAIVSKACRAFKEHIPEVFAASNDRFKDCQFELEISDGPVTPVKDFKRRMKSARSELFSIEKVQDQASLEVSVLSEKEGFDIPRNVIGQIIGDAIKEVVFGNTIPNVFIVSAERTGAAIFRKELDFVRNRILEEIGQNDGKSVDRLGLLTKDYQDYPLPVKANVDFVRGLEAISKQSSFIEREHGEILEKFSDILGGDFSVKRSDRLYFVPSRKRVRLSMDESSSSVRSLLDIGFYLRHVARAGDLLNEDEPELNLHPDNQRKLARLFSTLARIGIKVFVTTHSDFIVKELSSLIMLRAGGNRLSSIAEKHGYAESELLDAAQVRVYVAKKAKVLEPSKERRSMKQTLVAAKISTESGIDMDSFDSSIDEINRVQDEILWGE